MFLNSIQATVLMLMVILTGAFSCKIGWLDAEKHSIVPAMLVSYVTGACSVFDGMLNSMEKSYATHYIMLFVAALAAQLILLYGVYAAVKRIKSMDGKRGVFACMCGLPNVLFVGLPIATMIYGDSAIPPFMLIYVANTLAVWLFGIPLISADGNKSRTSTAASLKKALLATPVIAFFVSLIFLFFDITPPALLLRYAGLLGSATSPLAMFYIGMVLYQCGLSSLKLDKTVAIQLAVRFALSPLLALLFSKLMGFEPFTTQILVLAFGMPSAMQPAISAKTEGSDHVLGMRCCVISALASVVMIPVYIRLLT